MRQMISFVQFLRKGRSEPSEGSLFLSPVGRVNEIFTCGLGQYFFEEDSLTISSNSADFSGLLHGDSFES